MKKKLALLMAAIMTVAMVPMTAFASTKLTAVDEISTAVGDKHPFTSRVELSVNDDEEIVTDVKDYPINAGGTRKGFEVTLKLTNGKFAKDANDNYLMDGYENVAKGILGVEVESDTTATVILRQNIYNQVEGGSDITSKACVLPIQAYAVDTGDVVATFSSNITQFKKSSEVIATAYDGDVVIESEGVVTFVEDASSNVKNIKDITIDGLVNNAMIDSTGKAVITLKLSGNFEFVINNGWLQTVDANGQLQNIDLRDVVTLLNDNGTPNYEGLQGSVTELTSDKLVIQVDNINADQITMMRIQNIAITPTKKCSAGDVAKLKVSGKEFDTTATLEIAKMVEEAVTYTVEDEDLPVIWAGKDYAEDMDTNTLELAIEENTGDILNTSRKATFTFPEGIEVVGAEFDGVEKNGTGNPVYKFKYEIDENVVTIWNYGEDNESDETDMTVKFILNAAPTYSGDVNVTLGGEFDDVELKLATVKAPYTVEAKTSEVLIDYRYVPVNEIVITEAEEGILADDDEIFLQVEKMDFEDAGTYEVTSGDIDVDVTIEDGVDDRAQLKVTVKDESTEASTITISGLELYLDRTLPVGGYALDNVGVWDRADYDRPYGAANILWENSSETKAVYDFTPDADTASNGIFKYSAVTCNDSYVEVVTAGRDQDDSSTTRKIVITIGATTMAVGTETVTLDAPAYINSDNYTMLPLRAVSEAFGATVGWDDASRTVTLMMGQRIVSMTIGSKTMYINGTPVAMNTAPEIVSERTFLPVRDLCNALGITKIDWNEASATVTLN